MGGGGGERRLHAILLYSDSYGKFVGHTPYHVECPLHPTLPAPSHTQHDEHMMPISVLYVQPVSRRSYHRVYHQCPYARSLQASSVLCMYIARHMTVIGYIFGVMWWAVRVHVKLCSHTLSVGHVTM